jgi:hypothetical protein
MMVTMVIHVALACVQEIRSMAAWATTDEVQNQEQQDEDDGSKQEVEPPGQAGARGVVGGKSIIPLALAITGDTPRFVHR